MLETKEKQESEVKNFVLSGSPLKSKTLFRTPYFKDSFEFPFNPDPFSGGNVYDVYDEMRHDDQVKAVINIKKDFVVNTGWKIECEEEEIRDFVTNSLKAINEGSSVESSFDDILRDMLTSYEYGFSLSEPIFKIKEDNFWHYSNIKVRPPHGFEFEIDDFGNVLVVRQQTNTGPIEFKPSLFLHHVYQQEFGNPFGRSDLRSAHDPWKAKKFVSRFLAIYLERHAGPTVAGFYKSNTDPTDIQRFLDMLKTIQNSTSLAIPEDMKIEFIQAKTDASDAYIKALGYFNAQIARSVLVPDLMGLSGPEQKGGSFALGKKQFDIFMGTIKKDRRSLSRKITLKIVRPLVEVNFGQGINCDFEFSPFTEDDENDLIKVWTDAVKGRVFEPTEDEINHLRRKTGFPEGPVIITPPQPVAPPFGGNGPLEVGDKVGVPDIMEPLQGKMGQEIKTFREKTAFEKKVNFVMLKTVLNESDKAVSPKLESAATNIYTDFIDQIRKKGLLKRLSPEKINKLQPKFLVSMNAIFKKHFKNLFFQSRDQARKELFPNGTKSFAEEPLLPDEFVEVIEADSFKAVGDYSQRMTGKAKNIVMQAVKDGIGEGEVVKLLRDELKNVTETWIRTVVRTKTTEFYNKARRSYWEKDPIASQIVEAYQFSAIIDDRTSEICEFLDGEAQAGKTYSVNDSDIHRVTPPLHFNCRSVLVPVTRFEDHKEVKVPGLERIQDKGGNLKSF